MLEIKEGLLEYTCSVASISEILLMDTSYKYRNGVSENIISDDERAFAVNRLEKALRKVADIFGDAYKPSSLFIDDAGICGLSIFYSDRIIADRPDRKDALDAMINDYIISFVKNEWYALMGDSPEKEVSGTELWNAANDLFSYKYVPSCEIKEV